MKPCKGCEDSPDGYGRCLTFEFCWRHIDWQEEVKLMQEADPQDERGMRYMIDDREI